jgi:hypothetical protein
MQNRLVAAIVPFEHHAGPIDLGDGALGRSCLHPSKHERQRAVIGIERLSLFANSVFR